MDLYVFLHTLLFFKPCALHDALPLLILLEFETFILVYVLCSFVYIMLYLAFHRNDGLLAFVENFVKDHFLPTMFVDYRKGVQQAISSKFYDIPAMININYFRNHMSVLIFC